MKETDLQATIDRLNAIAVSNSEVARACRVSEAWVRNFRQGRYPDPGFRKVCRVVAFVDQKTAPPAADAVRAA